MACTRDLVSAIRVKADIPGDALMSANSVFCGCCVKDTLSHGEF